MGAATREVSVENVSLNVWATDSNVCALVMNRETALAVMNAIRDGLASGLCEEAIEIRVAAHPAAEPPKETPK